MDTNNLKSIQNCKGSRIYKTLFRKNKFAVLISRLTIKLSNQKNTVAKAQKNRSMGQNKENGPR